jgi:predicted Co/Zn/Cd cation transporter (cation efflux family)
MTFLMLEGAALFLTLLVGWEMRRQRVPWRTVVIRSAMVLALLTVVIIAWRGR